MTVAHSPGTQQRASWYIVDPNELRQEAGSPIIFAKIGSDDDDDLDVPESGSRAPTAIRRSSITTHMASKRDRSFPVSDPDLVPTQSNARQSEDSTTTVRRPSYDETEGGASVTITSSNRDQPPLPPADWSMFAKDAGISPTDDLVEHVYQGIDLDYIFNVGGPGGLDSRRSSLSFVAPQYLPLTPSMEKRKSRRKKNKEGEDFYAAVTLEDSFLCIRHWDDPDYELRRDEWSFIRKRERVSLPPREPDGNPRLWDVWRCSQIGQIRIEQATLPPCTCISVPFLATC